MRDQITTTTKSRREPPRLTIFVTSRQVPPADVHPPTPLLDAAADDAATALARPLSEHGLCGRVLLLVRDEDA